MVRQAPGRAGVPRVSDVCDLLTLELHPVRAGGELDLPLVVAPRLVLDVALREQAKEEVVREEIQDHVDPVDVAPVLDVMREREVTVPDLSGLPVHALPGEVEVDVLV